MAASMPSKPLHNFKESFFADLPWTQQKWNDGLRIKIASAGEATFPSGSPFSSCGASR
jgi:hypothetical protein